MIFGADEAQIEQIMDFAWANPEANAMQALQQINALAERYPDDRRVTDAGAMIYKLASSVARGARSITDQVTTGEAQP
jgi:outer membrane protein assembly factor BamD (BamD/ComL family)